MTRPLLAVTSVYVAGLLFAEVYQPPLHLLFTVALVFASLALGISRIRGGLLWILLFLTGWTNLVYRASPLSPFDLRRMQGQTPEIVRVRGELQDTPTERTTTTQQIERLRYLSIVEVSAISKRTGEWKGATG